MDLRNHIGKLTHVPLCLSQQQQQMGQGAQDMETAQSYATTTPTPAAETGNILQSTVGVRTVISASTRLRQSSICVSVRSSSYCSSAHCYRGCSDGPLHHDFCGVLHSDEPNDCHVPG